MTGMTRYHASRHPIAAMITTLILGPFILAVGALVLVAFAVGFLVDAVIYFAAGKRL